MHASFFEFFKWLEVLLNNCVFIILYNVWLRFTWLSYNVSWFPRWPFVELVDYLSMYAYALDNTIRGHVLKVQKKQCEQLQTLKINEWTLLQQEFWEASAHNFFFISKLRTRKRRNCYRTHIKLAMPTPKHLLITCTWYLLAKSSHNIGDIS